MSRYYIQLECGCLVSCDGGGGLMPGCGNWNDEGFMEESPNCKVDEYLKIHKIRRGWCKVCHPREYRKEIINAWEARKYKRNY
jgi:hypothetical protein